MHPGTHVMDGQGVNFLWSINDPGKGLISYPTELHPLTVNKLQRQDSESQSTKNFTSTIKWF